MSKSQHNSGYQPQHMNASTQMISSSDVQLHDLSEACILWVGNVCDIGKQGKRVLSPRHATVLTRFLSKKRTLHSKDRYAPPCPKNWLKGLVVLLRRSHTLIPNRSSCDRLTACNGAPRCPADERRAVRLQRQQRDHLKPVDDHAFAHAPRRWDIPWTLIFCDINQSICSRMTTTNLCKLLYVYGYSSHASILSWNGYRGIRSNLTTILMWKHLKSCRQSEICSDTTYFLVKRRIPKLLVKGTRLPGECIILCSTMESETSPAITFVRWRRTENDQTHLRPMLLG